MNRPLANRTEFFNPIEGSTLDNTIIGKIGVLKNLFLQEGTVTNNKYLYGGVHCHNIKHFPNMIFNTIQYNPRRLATSASPP